MKTNYRRVPTRFGPETRFELRPTPPAPFRAFQENELDKLKERLLATRLETLNEAGYNAYLRRAANEAAAIAWVTAYPTLVFPTLFEEKAKAALFQAEKQEWIRERSALLLAV
jgi:hypothetical protein